MLLIELIGKPFKIFLHLSFLPQRNSYKALRHCFVIIFLFDFGYFNICTMLFAREYYTNLF